MPGRWVDFLNFSVCSLSRTERQTKFVEGAGQEACAIRNQQQVFLIRVWRVSGRSGAPMPGYPLTTTLRCPQCRAARSGTLDRERLGCPEKLVRNIPWFGCTHRALEEQIIVCKRLGSSLSLSISGIALQCDWKSNIRHDPFLASTSPSDVPVVESARALHLFACLSSFQLSPSQPKYYKKHVAKLFFQGD